MANVLHSHATGIHPGAYVQDTAPDTTDVQDGVLWIDTADRIPEGTPPYRRVKCWHAATSSWQPVGSVVYFDDVTEDPPPQGALLVTNQGDGPPWQLKVYEPYASAFQDVGVQVIVATNAPGNPLGERSLWVDTSTGPPYPLSVRDADAPTGWSLLGPAPDMPAPPDGDAVLCYNGGSLEWVGADAAEGALLMKWADGWHPLPVGAEGEELQVVGGTPEYDVDLPLPPAPIAVPPVTVPMGADVQVRCGVASAMTDHLTSLYNQWSKWIAAGLSVLGAVAGAVLVGFLDGFFAPLSPEITAIYLGLRPAIAAATGAFLSTALPSLTGDQNTALIHDIFCALAVTSGTCVPTAANITSWQGAIEASGGPWANDMQRDLLNLILQFTPLDDWLVAASGSAQSSACDGMTCG